MGRILILPDSDFSRNQIVKVDITKEVEKTVDSHTSSSSTVSVIKNNNQ